jgi:hypothetical protein
VEDLLGGIISYMIISYLLLFCKPARLRALSSVEQSVPSNFMTHHNTTQLPKSTCTSFQSGLVKFPDLLLALHPFAYAMAPIRAFLDTVANAIHRAADRETVRDAQRTEEA